MAELILTREMLRAKEVGLVKEAETSQQELAQVREAMARTEQEIQKRLWGLVVAHERPSDLQNLEEVTRRIHHLQVAVENLMAAGAKEVAAQVMKQAEEMERDGRAARERMGGPGRPAHLEEQVQDLRKEVERLRAEVEVLKRQVRKP